MAGWIKLYRELGDKPIWLESTSDQRSVLMALLMMVNYEPNKWEWQGKQYECMPGQVITSLPKIAERSGKGVSIQNVRTALKRFEKLGFLTDESTNKNRLITIVNWAIYQGSDDEPNRQTNKQLTGNQQAANRQLTAIKNIRTKEGKNKEVKDIVEQEPDPIPYREIIDYLNQKAGKSFKHSAVGNKKVIKARWNEGYKLDQFKRVVDNKCQDWLNDEKMSQYLQPSTLFGNKFDQYLNQRKGNGNGAPQKSEEALMMDELSRRRMADMPKVDPSEFF
ncbi:conserved phage C-terminal domain-containing protein [Trichococcus shcherbakoviae]|uniref:Phage conserved hypothetical protein C-terminal domain-containing protein n=1 Tax=Trichococcus shcherbakoviae TaxID=2094020 RepID=A0A383TF68_9LACT|nr:conserved phage C-terminal domain-containing protein [Trichococcus shcherbakoviae]SYZ78517.1 Hypothetical protein TART1_1301 [Trichococcus shcherbakoviae]